MLELDDTEDRIRALIGNFENLNRAHDAVVRARSQIDALDPFLMRPPFKFDAPRFGTVHSRKLTVSDRATNIFSALNRSLNVL
jgi:hypothetical protein